MKIVSNAGRGRGKGVRGEGGNLKVLRLCHDENV